MVSAPPRRPSSGSQYELLELLGAGGFGEVYRARYLGPMGFVRDVAIKLLHNGVDERAQPVERLRDEARILGMLSHPNIVQVLRPAVIEGRWAIVMEHCEGVSLSAFVGEQRAPPQTMPQLCVVETLEIVAGALLYAYEARGPDGAPLRVLHRDLKPSNLHLTLTGHLKLLDFGVAHGLFDAREAATDMIVMGTLSYMAPERLRGEDSPAGDVFALGVTAIELLTGLPYGSPSQDGMSAAALWERARGRMGQLLPGVEGLLSRMMSRRAADRPSLSQVRDEARAIRRGVDAVDVTLADWAMDVVPPTLDRLRARNRAKPSRVGEVIHEQSVGAIIDADAPLPGAAPPPRLEPAPLTVPVSLPGPRAPRASGGALRGLGLSGLVTLGALLIGLPLALAGGLAYRDAQRAGAARDVTEPPQPAAPERRLVTAEERAEPATVVSAAQQDAPAAPRPARSRDAAQAPPPGGDPPAPRAGAVWVSVSGNVESVMVSTPKGQVRLPAALPPGRYPMSVQFAQAVDPAHTTLEVPTEGPLRLRCMWEFLNCVPQDAPR